MDGSDLPPTVFNYGVGPQFDSSFILVIWTQQNNNRNQHHKGGYVLSASWGSGKGDDVADVCHAGNELYHPLQA